MVADYEAEDLDTVTVRAGTFPALRIVRTLRLPAAGDRVMARTQVILVRALARRRGAADPRRHRSRTGRVAVARLRSG